MVHTSPTTFDRDVLGKEYPTSELGVGDSGYGSDGST